MVYACRICPYDEIAENKCVYRNDLLTVTKCVLRCFVLIPLSVFFFSHSGSRRESRPTSARIQHWCVPFTFKAAGYVNGSCLVLGSLKHDLPKLRELRVLIPLLERHWR